MIHSSVRSTERLTLGAVVGTSDVRTLAANGPPGGILWCAKEDFTVVERHVRNARTSTQIPSLDPTTRVRLIERVDDLLDEPVTAEELRQRCVVVRAPAAGAGDTVSIVESLLPWMSVWRDHPSWRTGAWRCVVGGPVDGPKYTAYEPQTLHFHTDMSRYLRPPEFTVIRCTVPDAGGGGDNLVLHIDDVIDRLRHRGRQDIVDMLAMHRVLNTEQRHINIPLSQAGDAERSTVRACIAVASAPATPSRVFDRHGATKGSHLELSAADELLLDEFIDECANSHDLAVRVRLERHDVLIFSNWRMLHARLACHGSGRVTEICMGNVPDTEHSRPSGVLGGV